MAITFFSYYFMRKYNKFTTLVIPHNKEQTTLFPYYEVMYLEYNTAEKRNVPQIM